MDDNVLIWIFPLASFVFSFVIFMCDVADYTEQKLKPKQRPWDIWYFYLLAPYIFVGLSILDMCSEFKKKFLKNK